MQAVLFDLDGTLLDHDFADRIAVKSLYDAMNGSSSGTPFSNFQSRWQLLTQEYYARFVRGELSFLQQRRARIRELMSSDGSEISDGEADSIFAVYLDAYESWWKSFPDVGVCLRDLGSIPKGVLTNGNTDQQRAKLLRIGLLDSFSLVLTSEKYGRGKPDAAFFREGCRLLRVKPKDCIYVGDDPVIDVEGSTAAGMRGVWINRDGRVHSRPIPSVFRLDQITEMVIR
jgi:putative hydrolase of the HAD superfamily